MNHVNVVLGSIVPDRRDRLAKTIAMVDEAHFREEMPKNVFKLLVRYYDMTASVLPREAMSDILERQGVEVARQLMYEEFYDELVNMDVSEAELRYSLDALRDIRATQLTGEAITTAYEILEKGVEVNKREYRGHSDARNYLYETLGKVDRVAGMEEAPEGDVRHETEEILKDYAQRKSGSTARGVFTGIQSIDKVTSGLQPGELVLVCGYTGEGKSMFATQIAWNAAVNFGKNVFFATSETIRQQVIRRIVARHSRLPVFGVPEGLNSAALKNGSLSPEQEAMYEEVVRDLGKNPEYGRLFVTQIPRGGTIGFLESRLGRQQAQWSVDLVVIDYLALLHSERKWQVQREEYNDIIKGAKVMAATFDNGAGVPVVSPWAMSQSAFKEALRVGEYTLANLAETSEAEKSADQILSMLRLPDRPGFVKMQFLKNRDGECPKPFELETDYRCAYLGEPAVATMDSLLDDSGEAWIA